MSLITVDQKILTRRRLLVEVMDDVPVAEAIHMAERAVDRFDGAERYSVDETDSSWCEGRPYSQATELPYPDLWLKNGELFEHDPDLYEPEPEPPHHFEFAGEWWAIGDFSGKQEKHHFMVRCSEGPFQDFKRGNWKDNGDPKAAVSMLERILGTPPTQEIRRFNRRGLPILQLGDRFEIRMETCVVLRGGVPVAFVMPLTAVRKHHEWLDEPWVNSDGALVVPESA